MNRGQVTERIRAALDIVDVVAEHVALRRAGRDYKGLCPFHQEKTPSFYVIPSKEAFFCFGCNVGGDVFKFIQLKENVSFAEARASADCARAARPCPAAGPQEALGHPPNRDRIIPNGHVGSGPGPTWEISAYWAV